MNKNQTLLLAGGFLAALLILAYSSIDESNRPFQGDSDVMSPIYMVFLIVVLLAMGGFWRWRRRK